MRYSKPLEGQNETAERRFWAKVDMSGECWLWTASLIDGYGQFRIGGEGTRNVKSHVVAYTWMVGDVPSGMTLDHTCRVRSCVNPAHLEPVTPNENLARGAAWRMANTDLCPHGHRWDALPVVMSGGYRVCGSCTKERRSTPEAKAYHREHSRQWYLRKLAQSEEKAKSQLQLATSSAPPL